MQKRVKLKEMNFAQIIFSDTEYYAKYFHTFISIDYVSFNRYYGELSRFVRSMILAFPIKTDLKLVKFRTVAASADASPN